MIIQGHTWFDSSDTEANLYIVYDDPDGKIWVETGGGGGSGDGAKSLSTYAPAGDIEEGTLWWNTNDNTLYIFYIDDDTSQVAASPQGGEGGSQALVSETAPNLVIMTKGHCGGTVMKLVMYAIRR